MHGSCELGAPGQISHRKNPGSGTGRSQQLSQSSADAVAQSAASPWSCLPARANSQPTCGRDLPAVTSRSGGSFL